MADTEKNKELMIQAIHATFGIISRAAKAAGIGRETHYFWAKEDPEYLRKCNEAVAAAKEHRLDVVETMAMKRVMEGSDSMIQFLLRTIGKSRGYAERVEVEHSGSIEAKAKNMTIEEILAERERLMAKYAQENAATMPPADSGRTD